MSENYTYAVARIRALEAKMLSPVQVGRMVESPDLDRAFFVLNETTYADHISGSTTPFNYEDIIKAELTRVYKFLNYYAGDDPFLRILWHKFDYGNAKILIRAQKRKLEDVTEMLSEFGIVDRERLANYVMKGEGSIPPWLERAINAAVIAFEEDKRPAKIDEVLDAAFLDDLVATGDSLFKKFAILFRSMEYPSDLEGNNMAIEIIRGVKRSAFGVGPLIAFWLAKELECKTIRQVLIAKKHHLPNSLLKERIRSVYA